MKRIAVLLASYNGGQYIAAQLDSILAQSHPGLDIYIRDDGSSDDTVAVVAAYIRRFPDQVHCCRTPSAATGHLANFAALADFACSLKHDYYCFADQDDVWHPNKLALLLEQMQALESRCDQPLPLLVHSDLRVVDEQLNEIAPSFIAFQGLPDPRRQSHRRFLYQNVVTGCATLFNRPLLELATPLPTAVVVHDWWFALCAQFAGRIGYIDRPLLDYRQHGQNAIGATHFKAQKSYFKRRLYRTLLRFPGLLSQAIAQAGALDTRLAPRTGLGGQAGASLNRFKTLRHTRLRARLAYVSKYLADGCSWQQRIYLYGVFFLLPWITAEPDAPLRGDEKNS